MKKFALLCVVFCLLIGCNRLKPTEDGKNKDGKKTTTTAPQGTPSFTVAVSEYPSWSAFFVASQKGLINGKEGKLGPIEEKWGVDIVLKEADYDTCITLYGSKTVDAVCITNMDVLAPSLSRDSVAILPTSTSFGADACITVGIDTLDDLKGKTTYGLEKSVSQYTFERNLELKGLDPKDFPFKNMDPAAAAQAVQTGQENIKSIVVWNPFVLQTLRTREGTKRLFDSTTIPEEIIDMVVIGKDALAKEGGENFACAIIDTFYQISQRLGSSLDWDQTSDKKLTDDEKKTLVALGAKFSNLGLEDMKEVVKETRFYSTPDAGLTLFNSEKFQKTTTPKVTKFCASHDIVDKEPTVGFNSSNSQLNYTTKYIEKVKAKQ